MREHDNISEAEILQGPCMHTAHVWHRYGLWITTCLMIFASWVMQRPVLVEQHPVLRALVTGMLDVPERAPESPDLFFLPPEPESQR